MTEESKKEGGETLKALLPLLADLIPLFLDKWADVNQRPSVRDLEERHVRMGRRIKKLAGQLTWHRVFFFVLLIWNVILTVLFAIK